MSACSALSVWRFFHRGRGWTLGVLLGLVTTSAINADALQPVRSDGGTELTFRTSAGNLVQVTVWQSKLAEASPYKNALLWGGDVGQPPQTVLSAIQVKSGDETISIPLSAYGDLGNVKWASLNPTKEGYSLSLHGGETATAYDAELSIAKGFLKTRVVRLREFPKQRWEKTTYSFTTGN
jgi:hypothetical protein